MQRPLGLGEDPQQGQIMSSHPRGSCSCPGHAGLSPPRPPLLPSFICFSQCLLKWPPTPCSSSLSQVSWLLLSAEQFRNQPQAMSRVFTLWPERVPFRTYSAFPWESCLREELCSDPAEEEEGREGGSQPSHCPGLP